MKTLNRDLLLHFKSLGLWYLSLFITLAVTSGCNNSFKSWQVNNFANQSSLQGFVINPNSVTVQKTKKVLFSAEKSTGDIKWAIEMGPGEINPDTGVFTAGNVTGEVIVKAMDSAGGQAFAVVKIVDSPAIYPAELKVSVGNRYGFSVVGGNPPYVFTIPSGEGTIDPRFGQFQASDEIGDIIVRVTDSLGAFADSKVHVGNRLSLDPRETYLGYCNGPDCVAAQKELYYTAKDGVPFDTTNGNPGYVLKLESGLGFVDSKKMKYTGGGTTGVSVISVIDSLGNQNIGTVHMIDAVQIDPKNPVIAANKSMMFTRLFGGQGPFLFQVVEKDGGTIDNKDTPGKYTAPSEPGTYHVRLVDQAVRGSQNYSEATVTVTESLSFMASSVEMMVDDQYDFDAGIKGGVPKSVFPSMKRGFTYTPISNCGGSFLWNINGENSIYKAPSKPCTEIVKITDSQSPTPNSILVTVYVREGMKISPKEISLAFGQIQFFTVTGGLPGDVGYKFSVTSGADVAKIDETTGKFEFIQEVEKETEVTVQVKDGKEHKDTAKVKLYPSLKVVTPVKLSVGDKYIINPKGGVGAYNYQVKGQCGKFLNPNLAKNEFTAMEAGQCAVTVTDTPVGNALANSKDIVMIVSAPLTITPASTQLLVNGEFNFISSGGVVDAEKGAVYEYTLFDVKTGKDLDSNTLASIKGTGENNSVGYFVAGDKPANVGVRVTDGGYILDEAVPKHTATAIVTIYNNLLLTPSSLKTTSATSVVYNGSSDTIKNKKDEIFKVTGGVPPYKVKVYLSDIGFDTPEEKARKLEVEQALEKNLTSTINSDAADPWGEYRFTVPVETKLGKDYLFPDGVESVNINYLITDSVKDSMDTPLNFITMVFKVNRPLKISPDMRTIAIGNSTSFKATGGTDDHYKFVLTPEESTSSEAFKKDFGTYFFSRENLSYTTGVQSGNVVVILQNDAGEVDKATITVKGKLDYVNNEKDIYVEQLKVALDLIRWSGGVGPYTLKSSQPRGNIIEAGKSLGPWKSIDQVLKTLVTTSGVQYEAGALPGNVKNELILLKLADSLGNTLDYNVHVYSKLKIDPVFVEMVIDEMQTFNVEGGFVKPGFNNGKYLNSLDIPNPLNAGQDKGIIQSENQDPGNGEQIVYKAPSKPGVGTVNLTIRDSFTNIHATINIYDKMDPGLITDLYVQEGEVSEQVNWTGGIAPYFVTTDTPGPTKGNVVDNGTNLATWPVPASGPVSYVALNKDSKGMKFRAGTLPAGVKQEKIVLTVKDAKEHKVTYNVYVYSKLKIDPVFVEMCVDETQEFTVDAGFVKPTVNDGKYLNSLDVPNPLNANKDKGILVSETPIPNGEKLVYKAPSKADVGTVNITVKDSFKSVLATINIFEKLDPGPIVDFYVEEGTDSDQINWTGGIPPYSVGTSAPGPLKGNVVGQNTWPIAGAQTFVTLPNNVKYMKFHAGSLGGGKYEKIVLTVKDAKDHKITYNIHVYPKLVITPDKVATVVGETVDFTITGGLLFPNVNGGKYKFSLETTSGDKGSLNDPANSSPPNGGTVKFIAPLDEKTAAGFIELFVEDGLGVAKRVKAVISLNGALKNTSQEVDFYVKENNLSEGVVWTGGVGPFTVKSNFSGSTKGQLIDGNGKNLGSWAAGEAKALPLNINKFTFKAGTIDAGKKIEDITLSVEDSKGRKIDYFMHVYREIKISPTVVSLGTGYTQTQLFTVTDGYLKPGDQYSYDLITNTGLSGGQGEIPIAERKSESPNGGTAIYHAPEVADASANKLTVRVSDSKGNKADAVITIVGPPGVSDVTVANNKGGTCFREGATIPIKVTFNSLIKLKASAATPDARPQLDLRYLDDPSFVVPGTALADYVSPVDLNSAVNDFIFEYKVKGTDSIKVLDYIDDKSLTSRLNGTLFVDNVYLATAQSTLPMVKGQGKLATQTSDILKACIDNLAPHAEIVNPPKDYSGSSDPNEQLLGVRKLNLIIANKAQDNTKGGGIFPYNIPDWIVAYKYKIVSQKDENLYNPANPYDCATGGYNEGADKNNDGIGDGIPSSTNITDALSSADFPDETEVKICLVGQDKAGNWQQPADATAYIWKRHLNTMQASKVVILNEPKNYLNNVFDLTASTTKDGKTVTKQILVAGSDQQVNTSTDSFDPDNTYVSSRDGLSYDKSHATDFTHYRYKFNSLKIAHPNFELLSKDDKEQKARDFCLDSNVDKFHDAMMNSDQTTMDQLLKVITFNATSTYSGQTNLATNIISGLDALEDGAIVLCAIGRDKFGNWQSTTEASYVYWIKDTTPPVAKIYDLPQSFDDKNAVVSKRLTASNIYPSSASNIWYSNDKTTNITIGDLFKFAGTTETTAKDLVSYRYKIGSTSVPDPSRLDLPAKVNLANITTYCKDLNNYSAEIEFDSATSMLPLILADLESLKLSGNQVTVCVIGKDEAGNWQNLLELNPATSKWDVKQLLLLQQKGLRAPVDISSATWIFDMTPPRLEFFKKGMPSLDPIIAGLPVTNTPTAGAAKLAVKISGNEDLSHHQFKVVSGADAAQCTSDNDYSKPETPYVFNGNPASNFMTISYDMTTKQDGDYTLCVRGRDFAGNFSTISHSWYRDTTPPQGIIVNLDSVNKCLGSTPPVADYLLVDNTATKISDFDNKTNCNEAGISGVAGFKIGGTTNYPNSPAVAYIGAVYESTSGTDSSTLSSLCGNISKLKGTSASTGTTVVDTTKSLLQRIVLSDTTPTPSPIPIYFTEGESVATKVVFDINTTPGTMKSYVFCYAVRDATGNWQKEASYLGWTQDLREPLAKINILDTNNKEAEITDGSTPPAKIDRTRAQTKLARKNIATFDLIIKPDPTKLQTTGFKYKVGQPSSGQTAADAFKFCQDNTSILYSAQPTDFDTNSKSSPFKVADYFGSPVEGLMSVCIRGIQNIKPFNNEQLLTQPTHYSWVYDITPPQVKLTGAPKTDDPSASMGVLSVKVEQDFTNLIDKTADMVSYKYKIKKLAAADAKSADQEAMTYCQNKDTNDYKPTLTIAKITDAITDDLTALGQGEFFVALCALGVDEATNITDAKKSRKDYEYVVWKRDTVPPKAAITNLASLNSKLLLPVNDPGYVVGAFKLFPNNVSKLDELAPIIGAAKTGGFIIGGSFVPDNSNILQDTKDVSKYLAKVALFKDLKGTPKNAALTSEDAFCQDQLKGMAVASSVPIATYIADDISAIKEDGTVILCVAGVDAANNSQLKNSNILDQTTRFAWVRVQTLPKAMFKTTPATIPLALDSMQFPSINVDFDNATTPSPVIEDSTYVTAIKKYNYKTIVTPFLDKTKSPAVKNATYPPKAADLCADPIGYSNTLNVSSVDLLPAPSNISDIYFDVSGNVALGTVTVCTLGILDVKDKDGNSVVQDTKAATSVSYEIDHGPLNIELGEVSTKTKLDTLDGAGNGKGEVWNKLGTGVQFKVTLTKRLPADFDPKNFVVTMASLTKNNSTPTPVTGISWSTPVKPDWTIPTVDNGIAKWSYEVSFPGDATCGDCTYAIQYPANMIKDKVGNSNTASNKIVINIDNLAPVVEVPEYELFPGDIKCGANNEACPANSATPLNYFYCANTLCKRTYYWPLEVGSPLTLKVKVLIKNETVVTGFDAKDIKFNGIANASDYPVITDFKLETPIAGQVGTIYSFSLTPKSDGPIQVKIDASAFADRAGNQNVVLDLAKSSNHTLDRIPPILGDITTAADMVAPSKRIIAGNLLKATPVFKWDKVIDAGTCFATDTIKYNIQLYRYPTKLNPDTKQLEMASSPEFVVDLLTDSAVTTNLTGWDRLFSETPKLDDMKENEIYFVMAQPRDCAGNLGSARRGNTFYTDTQPPELTDIKVGIYAYSQTESPSFALKEGQDHSIVGSGISKYYVSTPEVNGDGSLKTSTIVWSEIKSSNTNFPSRWGTVIGNYDSTKTYKFGFCAVDSYNNGFDSVTSACKLPQWSKTTWTVNRTLDNGQKFIPKTGTGGTSRCPAGFIYVPGDSAKEISSFCVSRYEMVGNAASPPESAPAKVQSSTVTKKAAITYCNKLVDPTITDPTKITSDDYYNIPTNQQWNYLAKMAFDEDANWTGGSNKENSRMASGLSGFSALPKGISPADASESNLFSGTNAAVTKVNETYVGDEQRRVLYLKDLVGIWDLSGNLQEWVLDSIPPLSFSSGLVANNQLYSLTSSTFFNPVNIFTSIRKQVFLGDNNFPAFPAGLVGIGKYTPQSNDNVSMTRGGSLLFPSANAGVYSMSMKATKDDTTGDYTDVGFRCVTPQLKVELLNTCGNFIEVADPNSITVKISGGFYPYDLSVSGSQGSVINVTKVSEHQWTFNAPNSTAGVGPETLKFIATDSFGNKKTLEVVVVDRNKPQGKLAFCAHDETPVQDFKIPNNSTWLRVSAWGAGGSSSGGAYGIGGGGGFIKTKFNSTTLNADLKVIVSKGGERVNGNFSVSGGGGGLVGVFEGFDESNKKPTDPIIVAGSGGGSSYFQGTGGAGGGGTQYNGLPGENSSSENLPYLAKGGAGGTGSQGGALGDSGAFAGYGPPITKAGSQFQGGDGCGSKILISAIAPMGAGSKALSDSLNAGGGGGAGYYGGGGGGCGGKVQEFAKSWTKGAGGGGGSAYVDTSIIYTGETVLGAAGVQFMSGGYNDPEYQSNKNINLPDYIYGVGMGGIGERLDADPSPNPVIPVNEQGGPGLIIIEWGQ
jgi:hypothetical protein